MDPMDPMASHGLPGTLGADGRNDSAWPQGALRGAPRRQHLGRRAGGCGHIVGALDILGLLIMVIINQDDDGL